MTKNNPQTVTSSYNRTPSSKQRARRPQPSRPTLPTAERPPRLASGLIGSAVLTALNESGRHLLPSAPRLDVLGTLGVEKIYHALHLAPPSERRLRAVAFVGDIITNTLYYSRVPS